MQGAKIYQKLYPEKAALIDFKEVGRSQFPAEVLEFNQKGSGWPDVVFIEPDILTQVVDSQHDFPLDLNPVLPPDLLGKFELHAHDVCTFGDKLYCLRHDTSPMVLYYNQPLMKEFGYSVPATWQEYQAIGERVASEHPGYYIGSFGDGAGFKTYFDASGCASSLVQGEKSVVINFEDERCKRAARLVDTLLANGVLAPYSLFDPRFNQIAQQNKLLMLIGPAWLALYSFSGKPGAQYYQTAERQLGVAAPLRWQGEKELMTSAMGGAGWVVSKHTQNVPLALDFIIWMVSAPEFWAISPDYPVYLPIQPEWEKVVSANLLFANDPFPAMQTGSLAISPHFTLPSYNVMDVLNNFVSRVVREKKSLESLLPELQSTMIARAQAAGYTVQTQRQP
jgi:ABC-type glycerol-3-phosphate transport system substrate-binding protein